MRADRLSGQVLAVLTRRTPALAPQPRPAFVPRPRHHPRSRPFSPPAPPSTGREIAALDPDVLEHRTRLDQAFPSRRPRSGGRRRLGIVRALAATCVILLGLIASYTLRGDRTAAVTLVDLTGPVYSVVFSPDGRTLAAAAGAAGDEGAVILWDLTRPSAPRQSAVLTSPAGPIYSVAFSPNSRTLAGGAAGADAAGGNVNSTPVSGAVVLWDLTRPGTPRQLAVTTSRAGPVHSVAFSPDSRTLAGGVNGDNAVILWDVTSPTTPRQSAVLTSPLGPVPSVAFSPDGRSLAASVMGDASHGDVVILWDLTRPSAPRQSAVLTSPAGPIYSVAFSPDSRTLAGGAADHTTRLWSLAHLNRSRRLTGHTDGVASVAFSRDGHVLAAGSYDETVTLRTLR